MITYISRRYPKGLSFIIYHLSFSVALLCCTALTACQDGDWSEPSFSESPYGNNSITEEGLVTIAELKADPDYRAAISGSKAKLVEKTLKIKGRVTGNDLGGNLYKQLALQDETGAIIIAVNQNGLNGYLAEGQEIIVDLKGMYVGAYGSQPQIGTPYNGSIGRMSKDVWASHFKIVGGLGNINPQAIQPADFATIMGDINTHAGELVVLKGVRFRDADGSKTLTDGTASGGNYVNTYVTVGGRSVIVRTSTYADFAKRVMPTGEVDITGIATRYNNDWQILMRKTSDLVEK